MMLFLLQAGLVRLDRHYGRAQWSGTSGRDLDGARYSRCASTITWTMDIPANTWGGRSMRAWRGQCPAGGTKMLVARSFMPAARVGTTTTTEGPSISALEVL